MYVWHTAPAQMLDDVKTKEIVMGAQAPGSTQFDYPVLANRLFGFKFKVVTGYESTPKIHLAMESGEVHGTIANWSTLKAISSNWITEKKIRILAQWALKKNPELPDVPLFFDLAKTDAERAALRLMLARLEYGRPFFLPPNVPAARVEALRRAFDATMKDPAYLAEADKLKIEVDPLTGEQVAALVEQVSRTEPTPSRACARRWRTNEACRPTGCHRRFRRMAPRGRGGFKRTPAGGLLSVITVLPHRPLPTFWKPIWMQRPLKAARSTSHAWRMIRWCAALDVTPPTPR